MEETQEKHVRRLGIFVCRDDAGIMDADVLHLMKDIRGSLTDLIVVFQGEKLLPESRKALYSFTEDVVVRKDSGLDVAGWKFAMTEYWDWNRVTQQDELVLFNDAFFGPFVPFQKIFADMESKDVDFWGLLRDPAGEDEFQSSPWGTWPERIDPCFLAVRKEMLSSRDFRKFWTELPLPESLADEAGRFGAVFTKHFEDKGFAWDIYGSDPILRKKELSFLLGHALRATEEGELFRCLERIDEMQDYDKALLWPYMIRRHHLRDIFHFLPLQYVPEKAEEGTAEEELPGRTLLVLDARGEKGWKELQECLEPVPAQMDVVALTDEEGIPDALETHENLEIVHGAGHVVDFLLENRSQIEAYEYLGVLSIGSGSLAEGHALAQESLLGSRRGILAILRKLRDMKELGLVVPPVPISPSRGSWDGRYEGTARLAEEMELGVPLDEGRLPLAKDLAFWARAEVLRVLWDSPASARNLLKQERRVAGCLLPFVAQSRGYCTAWAMSAGRAAVEERARGILAEARVSGLEMMERRLRETTDILKYLDMLYLVADRYTILLSVRDTPGSCVSKDIVGRIHALGFTGFRTNLWEMYVGIRRQGKVLCDRPGEAPEDPVEFRYQDPLDGRRIFVASRAWRRGDRSEIRVDGVEWSANCRGINIVVYDECTGRTVDSIGYDGHEKQARFERKALQ